MAYVQLQFGTMAYVLESPPVPHDFINSNSSESIERASGNRGVNLNGYGSGRLEFTSP